GILRAQAQGFEIAIGKVFAACDADPSCPVHGGASAAYDRVAAAVERRPLDAGDHTAGPSDLATAAFYATYDTTVWPELYDAIASADAGDGSGLYDMASSYRGFGAYTIYAAVECVDTPHPEGADAYAAFADELESISPRFGAAIANELLPCAFWPVQSTVKPA